MGYFTKKTLASVRETNQTSGLQKNLTAFDLIMIGLGGIIGAGVFVVTGMVAANYAGPAVTISYAIAGLTCIFVALAYSELAAMLPTSGSVYTYSYVAFGELFAWLVGSVLILELTFGAATVAAGWSGYIQSILEAGNIYLPAAYTNVPENGGIINLPAMFIVAFVSIVLSLGTKDSKKLNTILVFIKLFAVGAFILAAIPNANLKNWDNFMPFPTNGIFMGASILFFSFTGFSSVAAAAEECKNPKKDLTIGIVGSLILSTLVYVAIAALATLLAPYETLNNDQPLAKALTLSGSKLGSAIVAVGAVCGMTTVILMQLYAQSRILYVIARDGLLPKSFAKLHPKYDSPYIIIAFIGVIAALLTAFVPSKTLLHFTSMGSLIDYIMVSIIVIIFRFTMPDESRPFKCPAIFVVAPIALLACGYLLSKQIIDEDGKLLHSGHLIILWFAGIFALYVIRSMIIKIKR
ncbi:MAG: amino acid permease [Rickettsiaceae bacterium]|jgi:APA family basic amino acid/polyamine antiporter|nr:amino acid permease [Rickettsiaceae bacterium]